MYDYRTKERFGKDHTVFPPHRQDLFRFLLTLPHAVTVHTKRKVNEAFKSKPCQKFLFLLAMVQSGYHGAPKSVIYTRASCSKQRANSQHPINELAVTPNSGKRWRFILHYSLDSTVIFQPPLKPAILLERVLALFREFEPQHWNACLIREKKFGRQAVVAAAVRSRLFLNCFTGVLNLLSYVQQQTRTDRQKPPQSLKPALQQPPQQLSQTLLHKFSKNSSPKRHG